MARSGIPSYGFTLIELLIVVAIIGILAAIAIPNFLNAQMKAKVVRVIADQAALRTAIETYHIDWQSYMPYNVWGSHGDVRYTNALTTPVAYITNADLVMDPFFDREIAGVGRTRYGYYSDGGRTIPVSTGGRTTWQQKIQFIWQQTRLPGWQNFQYFFTSAGPDSIVQLDDGTNRPESPIYDPSNGLRSIGDIITLGPGSYPFY